MLLLLGALQCDFTQLGNGTWLRMESESAFFSFVLKRNPGVIAAVLVSVRAAELDFLCPSLERASKRDCLMHL